MGGNHRLKRKLKQWAPTNVRKEQGSRDPSMGVKQEGLRITEQLP